MNAPTRAAESTALAHLQPAPALTGRDLILHADNLNAMLTVAKIMCKAKQAVPKHLRENEGACLAVTMQAMRWNMDPFALAVKTYTTDAEGPVACEGQAIIAALNNSPLLATRLSFTWAGAWERIVGRFKEVESKKKDDRGNPILDKNGQPKKYIVPAWDFNTDEEGLSVTVSALLVGEKEPRTLTLLMKQARTRNSPLWTEDPKQQLAYLAGRRWGRLHAPDVIMGVYTPDELAEPIERFMGMAEEVGAPPPPPPPSGPPPYAAEAFERNLPAWRKLIEAGKKTAAEIITTVETKAVLSPEQRAAIEALQPKPAATAQAEDVTPKVTYAALADSLHKCTDAETAAVVLDEARALPADQQKDLAGIFNTKFPKE